MLTRHILTFFGYPSRSYIGSSLTTRSRPGAAIGRNVLLADRAEPPVRCLCLGVSAADDIDYSAAEVVRSVYARSRARGVRLVVTSVMEDVQAASRYRFAQSFGRHAFYHRLDDVPNAYREQSRSAAPER